MGFWNTISSHGSSCEAACGEVVCTPPDCSDCYIPFVNDDHTKSRYPRRAIVSVSGIAYTVAGGPWDGPDPPPDCGFCDCFNKTVLLSFLGLRGHGTVPGSWVWYYPSLPPAIGPFSFCGSEYYNEATGGAPYGDIDCISSGTDPIDFCPTTSATKPDTDWECTAVEKNAPAVLLYLPHSYITSPSSPVLLTVILELYDSSTVALGTVTLPDVISITNPCFPLSSANALVLPDGPQTVTISSGDFGTTEAGEYCSRSGASATIEFADWIERDFPA